MWGVVCGVCSVVCIVCVCVCVCVCVGLPSNEVCRQATNNHFVKMIVKS